MLDFPAADFSHYLSRFCLHQLQGYASTSATKDTQAKAAAVLILMRENHHGPELLLTQRSIHLRHHPGQISFPGGRQDSNDVSLIETALRETHEEVGILPQHIKPLGQLQPLYTHTGFCVTPIVARLTQPTVLRLSEAEVSAAFWLPLNALHPAHFRQLTVSRQGHVHTLYALPHQGKLIWGVTGLILHSLGKQLAR